MRLSFLSGPTLCRRGVPHLLPVPCRVVPLVVPCRARLKPDRIAPHGVRSPLHFHHVRAVLPSVRGYSAAGTQRLAAVGLPTTAAKVSYDFDVLLTTGSLLAARPIGHLSCRFHALLLCYLSVDPCVLILPDPPRLAL